MLRNLHFVVVFSAFPLFSFAQEAVSANSPGIAVIELFTSQGDINSPPADQLLSDIIADSKKRKNQTIFCLSMHVDFWNRYGWKDPFSSLKYTNRLMNYTSVLGMKETYTPLMILNGRNILPVKDSKKTFDIINGQLQKAALFNPVFTYQVFDDTLDISYNLNPAEATKTFTNLYLNIAIVEEGLVTEVTKGDNAGKNLKNDNVTRLFFSSDVTAAKGLVRVPLKKLKAGTNRSVILFVQDKKSRSVTGAATTPFR